MPAIPRRRDAAGMLTDGRRWKSVSYSEIGNTAPLQNIHPAGAKLPANIRISPTYPVIGLPPLVRL